MPFAVGRCSSLSSLRPRSTTAIPWLMMAITNLLLKPTRNAVTIQVSKIIVQTILVQINPTWHGNIMSASNIVNAVTIFIVSVHI